VEMPQRLAAGLALFRCERPAGVHIALGIIQEIGKIHADPAHAASQRRLVLLPFRIFVRDLVIAPPLARAK